MAADVRAVMHAGMGSLPDLLAPSWVEISRDHLCLEGHYARTYALTAYPRTVALGWLNRLIASGEHLDLSLHLAPLDTALAQAELTARMTQLRSTQLHADRGGRIDDAATGTALGDCRRVRQALQEGHDVLFSASLSVTVHGASLPDLNARSERVQRLVGALMAQIRPAVYQALAGLHSTLPAATDRLRVRRTLPASSLVTLFPFTAPRLEMEGGVLWGRNTDTNGLVIVNLWNLANANVAVMATSGAGKSYAIKLDLLRTLPLGVHILVIDPDDEYVGLATALRGQVVRLGPGSPHRLNPLALPATPRGLAHSPAEPWTRDEDAEGEDACEARPGGVDALAAHIASLLPLLEVLLAGEAARLSPREKGALETALAACYTAASITADPATHARRPPTFSDLAAALAARGDPDGLTARLERYCTGPYASIFNGQSTVDLDNRLVVFSLAALPEETTEPEVRAAVMLLIAAHVLRTAQRDRRQRRRIIVDEAHVLARYPAGDRFLATLARRARKYGLGVTAISQQLEDFLATASGQAVLKNSSTRLLLLQTAETLAALEQHLQLTAAERARLLTRQRGEGLVLVGRQRAFVRLEASPEEHRLCHTDAARHETIRSAVAPPRPGAARSVTRAAPADPSPGRSAPTTPRTTSGESGPGAVQAETQSATATAAHTVPTPPERPAPERAGPPTSGGAPAAPTGHAPERVLAPLTGARPDVPATVSRTNTVPPRATGVHSPAEAGDVGDLPDGAAIAAGPDTGAAKPLARPTRAGMTPWSARRSSRRRSAFVETPAACPPVAVLAPECEDHRVPDDEGRIPHANSL